MRIVSDLLMCSDHLRAPAQPYRPLKRNLHRFPSIAAATERLLNADIRALEHWEQRPIDLEERLQKLELAGGTPCDFRHCPLRVVVHENPYARIPVPADLFRGPWDERYGPSDGSIQQLFQGEKIAKLPPKN